MEEIITRFPHIAEQIFDKLKLEDTANCIESWSSLKTFYKSEESIHRRRIKRDFRLWLITKDSGGRLPLHKAAASDKFHLCDF